MKKMITITTPYRLLCLMAMLLLTAAAEAQTQTELNISYGNNSRTWASYYISGKSLEVPDGLEAYVVTSASTRRVVVQKISYIPRNMGVLLKRVSDDVEEPIMANAYTGAETSYINALRGTDSPLSVASVSGNVYVLYNDGFTRATTGTIPAHRAYLVLGGNAASSRIDIIEEETTGVDESSMFNVQSSMFNVQSSMFNVQSSMFNVQSSMFNVYDLQGRKLSSGNSFLPFGEVRRGIYIVNGHKVLLK